MPISLDHLVVAARTLEEGAAWVESRLHAKTVEGGKHPAMGTHNRLLSLGPSAFLEVISIDPGAPRPSRARWFELDEPRMKERIARGPALVHWVVRSEDIDVTLSMLPGNRPPVLELARGDFRWRIGVPDTGAFPFDGLLPTVIQWQGEHPASRLAPSGCTLERLVLRHGQPGVIRDALLATGLSDAEAVVTQPGASGLVAWIRSPMGLVSLGE